MHRTRRFASVALVGFAVVAVAGIGFAAFTANAYIHSAQNPGGPSAGGIDLIVTSLSVGAGTPAYAALTNITGINTGYATFDLGPLGPGDIAYLDYSIKNIGTLNIPSPKLFVTTNAANTCDSLFSAGSTGAPTFLNAGASYSGILTISEEPSPPAVCSGFNATVTLTVTGST